MNTYADVGANMQQIGGDCPDGWIHMEGPRPEDEDAANYTAQANGTWAVTAQTLREKLIPVENAWREQQMPLTLQTVTAIDFGEEGIAGTIDQWKFYWRELRKWTEANPDFPDSSKRPVAPT
ncbi:hypothetical protein [Pseudomonas fluorescens]|uniref:hypothetical protein n=1 Tax=Pseudomonas fluorescens TaxID=294 RepID=UPI001679875F|nr:hypothetical protein [Pseudomonas fluorescens]